MQKFTIFHGVEELHLLTQHVNVSCDIGNHVSFNYCQQGSNCKEAEELQRTTTLTCRASQVQSAAAASMSVCVSSRARVCVHIWELSHEEPAASNLTPITPNPTYAAAAIAQND